MTALRIACILLSLAASLSAQTPDPSHTIEKVDPAPPDGVIAIPIPPRQERRMKKYEIPELVGARQALGSQLVDGELPKPLLDYINRTGTYEQRVSLFHGGLTVVRMTTPGGEMRKKVILPRDVVAAYLPEGTEQRLAAIGRDDVADPLPHRNSRLRLYRGDGTHIELQFDPTGVLPKTLADQILPLQDLLRAISEDRTVTSSVANYDPRPGDELVSDDQKVWRVQRVIAESDVVELKCLDAPSVMYVDRRSLHNYFIGKRAGSGGR